jgi:hypothetical protein
VYRLRIKTLEEINKHTQNNNNKIFLILHIEPPPP